MRVRFPPSTNQFLTQTNNQIGDALTIKIVMKVTLTKKESNAKSTEVVSVNILELASELADMQLKLVWGETRKGLYEDEDACITTYSDEAQDIFNDLYDKYYSLIESIQEV